MSFVGYTYSYLYGGVRFGKSIVLYPEWWGAYSDETHATETTDAIQTALLCAERSMTYAHSYHYDTTGLIYGGYFYDSSVLPYTIGGALPIKFQAGTYLINDELFLPGNFPSIEGVKNATFIRQYDATKKILYGIDTKRAFIKGVTFVGGTTQIDIHNPATEDPGEVEITESYFVNNDPTRWSILVNSGNTFLNINKCVNRYTPKFLFALCDVTAYKDSWMDGFGTDGRNQIILQV